MLKPSSAAAATASLLHEIIAPALPEGVFQVLLGGAEAVRLLVGHPDVAAVSFTGSVPVGQDIARRVAARGGRMQAEMGGQNPSIVLADADLDQAAAAIAYAAMGYAGQKCTATSRVIVEEGVYADFRDRLAGAVTRLQVIDPAAEATLVGPVIDEGSRSAALAAGSMTCRRVTAPARRSRKSAYTASSTITRLVAVHFCPAYPIAA